MRGNNVREVILSLILHGFLLEMLYFIYCFICGVISYLDRRFSLFSYPAGYFVERYYVNGYLYHHYRRFNISADKAKAVKDLIDSDKVFIFSKTYCTYCKMAKEVFDGLKKSYIAVELDNRDDGDEIQSILGQITGARTVPRVFVNGGYLGGGFDVKGLHEKGELQKYFGIRVNGLIN